MLLVITFIFLFSPLNRVNPIIEWKHYILVWRKMGIYIRTRNKKGIIHKNHKKCKSQKYKRTLLSSAKVESRRLPRSFQELFRATTMFLITCRILTEVKKLGMITSICLQPFICLQFNFVVSLSQLLEVCYIAVWRFLSPMVVSRNLCLASLSKPVCSGIVLPWLSIHL